MHENEAKVGRKPEARSSKVLVVLTGLLVPVLVAVGCREEEASQKLQTATSTPESHPTVTADAPIIPPPGIEIPPEVLCAGFTQAIMDESNSLATNQLSVQFGGERISQGDTQTLIAHDACVQEPNELVGGILSSLVIVDPSERQGLMADLEDSSTVERVGEIHTNEIQ